MRTLRCRIPRASRHNTSLKALCRIPMTRPSTLLLHAIRLLGLCMLLRRSKREQMCVVTRLAKTVLCRGSEEPGDVDSEVTPIGQRQMGWGDSGPCVDDSTRET